MIDRLNLLSAAQWTGLAVVLLGVVLAAGWFVRRRVGFLRTLFIPAAVVSGFLVLLAGPQVLGALTGTQGLFPEAVIEVWRVIPGLMINVVFAAIMIGNGRPARPGSRHRPPHPRRTRTPRPHPDQLAPALTPTVEATHGGAPGPGPSAPRPEATVATYPGSPAKSLVPNSRRTFVHASPATRCSSLPDSSPRPSHSEYTMCIAGGTSPTTRFQTPSLPLIRRFRDTCCSAASMASWRWSSGGSRTMNLPE